MFGIYKDVSGFNVEPKEGDVIPFREIQVKILKIVNKGWMRVNGEEQYHFYVCKV